MGHLDLTVASLLTALGSAALKATAVLALAALLNRLLRRRPAALRHLVWTGGLGATVAVLVLPLVLPAWRVMPVSSVSVDLGLPDWPEAIQSPLQDGAGGIVVARQSGSTIPAHAAASHAVTPETPTAQQPAPRSNEPRWPALALIIWLVGVAAVLARNAWSRLALHRLASSSTVFAGSDVLADPMLRSMGIARPVSFRSSGDVELPLTWGILRPQVVLPLDASEWTSDCRRRVLQHELAHIARLDAATQLVAQAASAFFWFHPLVWYAVGQMRCERERACDDYVLASGAVATDYASDLLALVTTHGYVERHSVAIAFARRSHFEGRLLALLDRTVDRRVLSPRRVAMVLGLSTAIAIPLAALSAGARVVQRTASHLAEVATQAARITASSPETTASVEPVAAPFAAIPILDSAARAPLDHEDIVDPQAPAVHPVGAIVAKTKEPMGWLAGIHVLSTGRVVVNDVDGRRVLLFDSTLTTFSLLLDTTGTTARKYPAAPRPLGPGQAVGSVIPFLGDSTVFVDAIATALVVLDPDGRISRVMAPAFPRDVGYLLTASTRFDAAGRAVYRLRPALPARTGPTDVRQTSLGDSAPIVRAAAGAATPETLAFVRVPKAATPSEPFVTKEGPTIQRQIIDPFEAVDGWAMLPDGTIAIVRSRDYHVDWVAPDGRRSSSAKLPFQWHRLSDSEKVAIVDSVKTAEGAYPIPYINGNGVRGIGPGPDVIAPESLADYRPPFRPGATMGDADGNLWLLPTPEVPLSPEPGPVYDVVSRAGKLIDRVQLSPGFGIVGFSPGYVFMTIREGSTTVLVKAKIR